MLTRVGSVVITDCASPASSVATPSGFKRSIFYCRLSCCSARGSPTADGFLRAVSFRLPLAGNTCVAVRYRSSTGSWKSACVFQADATLDKPCCLVVSARQWTVRLTAERSRTRSSAINRGSSAGTFRRFPQASISSSAYDSHCRIRAVTRKSTTPFRLGYGCDALRGFKC